MANSLAVYTHLAKAPLLQVENILGNKGAAVRQISAETNARISVMDGMPGSDERVAIITSREDASQELSGAQVLC